MLKWIWITLIKANAFSIFQKRECKYEPRACCNEKNNYVTAVHSLYCSALKIRKFHCDIRYKMNRFVTGVYGSDCETNDFG